MNLKSFSCVSSCSLFGIVQLFFYLATADVWGFSFTSNHDKSNESLQNTFFLIRAFFITDIYFKKICKIGLILNSKDITNRYIFYKIASVCSSLHASCAVLCCHTLNFKYILLHLHFDQRFVQRRLPKRQGDTPVIPMFT